MRFILEFWRYIHSYWNYVRRAFWSLYTYMYLKVTLLFLCIIYIQWDFPLRLPFKSMFWVHLLTDVFLMLVFLWLDSRGTFRPKMVILIISQSWPAGTRGICLVRRVETYHKYEVYHELGTYFNKKTYIISKNTLMGPIIWIYDIFHPITWNSHTDMTLKTFVI